MYRPFGVAWLDSLSLFQSFNSNYCLVNSKTSCIIQDIAKYQEHVISLQRNKIVLDKYDEMQTVHVTYTHLIETIKKDYSAKIMQLDESNEVIGRDLAFICDIDCDFYLVPKMWVKEIVQKKMLEYVTAMLYLP